MPTLIDCYIVKDHSASFLALSAYLLRRKSFCLAAAEKRDCEAISNFRQAYFANFSKYLLAQLITSLQPPMLPFGFSLCCATERRHYSKHISDWQDVSQSRISAPCREEADWVQVFVPQ